MSDCVRDHVESYLEENGFTRAAYTAKTTTLFAGPLSFRVPNPVARQKVVPLHDIHHVVTGFGTDVVGEGEQGIWELRAGCPAPIAIALNGLAVASGFLLSPRRIVRAFRRAKNAHTLYVDGLGEQAALALPISELRAHLGVPPEGVAVADERRLHSHAPRRRPAFV